MRTTDVPGLILPVRQRSGSLKNPLINTQGATEPQINRHAASQARTALKLLLICSRSALKRVNAPRRGPNLTRFHIHLPGKNKQMTSSRASGNQTHLMPHGLQDVRGSWVQPERRWARMRPRSAWRGKP